MKQYERTTWAFTEEELTGKTNKENKNDGRRKDQGIY